MISSTSTCLPLIVEFVLSISLNMISLWRDWVIGKHILTFIFIKITWVQKTHCFCHQNLKRLLVVFSVDKRQDSEVNTWTHGALSFLKESQSEFCACIVCVKFKLSGNACTRIFALSSHLKSLKSRVCACISPDLLYLVDIEDD